MKNNNNQNGDINQNITLGFQLDNFHSMKVTQTANNLQSENYNLKV